VPELKNYVCDHMISYANTNSLFDVVSFYTMKKLLVAYKQLPFQSGLRRLLVHWFVRGVERGQFSMILEFAADLACAMEKNRRECPRTEKPFSELDRSKYYETMGYTVTWPNCFNPLPSFQPPGRFT